MGSRFPNILEPKDGQLSSNYPGSHLKNPSSRCKERDFAFIVNYNKGTDTDSLEPIGLFV